MSAPGMGMGGMNGSPMMNNPMMNNPMMNNPTTQNPMMNIDPMAATIANGGNPAIMQDHLMRRCFGGGAGAWQELLREVGPSLSGSDFAKMVNLLEMSKSGQWRPWDMRNEPDWNAIGRDMLEARGYATRRPPNAFGGYRAIDSSGQFGGDE